jgi:transcriptional regulator with AAA-type ATPase domain
MQPPLIGHPQRLEPFKSFLSGVARAKGSILMTGPTGAGKKRSIQFLMENGPLNQDPVFFLNGLQLSEDLWAQARVVLKSKGTLVLEGIQYLPLPLQSRFKDWLAGQGPLFAGSGELPSDWRIIVTSSSPKDIWEDLLHDFSYHIQLPSLNEVIEDIPYHIKYFLQDKSIRYLRYFFLLKTFFHQWAGNLRELEHYLLQVMAYYCSKAQTNGFERGREVFGETKLRYYQDILKEEWWYYPYRFLPDFTNHLANILTKTDFRLKIIEENLVRSLLKDEPGFLVFDLEDQEFEKKAIQVYTLFSNYLKLQLG